MRRSSVLRIPGIATIFVASLSSFAGAQSSSIQVIGGDSLPVPFAWVSVQGGAGNVTDDAGKLSLGAGRKKTLSVEVRRIGYAPWMGSIELPDSAAVFTVMLHKVAQQLAGITVTGEQVKSRLETAGFYDRWRMRQKGALSATFIGPEEIEKRHPSRASQLLEGVMGVSLMRTPGGGVVAKGNGGTCAMTVLLDGQRLCPPVGCNDPRLAQSLSSPKSLGAAGKADDLTVNINQFVDQNEIAAVEVYARGGNMPVSLQAQDNACGVIAIWTGSRR